MIGRSAKLCHMQNTTTYGLWSMSLFWRGVSGLHLTTTSPREGLHREGGTNTIHSSDHSRTCMVCAWLTFQGGQCVSHNWIHMSEFRLAEPLHLRLYGLKAFN